MSKALIHVGMTVKDLDRTIAFYEKYFGFHTEMRGAFPADFFQEYSSLYGLKEGVYSDIAFLVSPNGIVLELFQFSEIEEAGAAPWTRTGYHHLCLMVESVPEIYKTMSSEGVEFYFPPAYRGDPKDNAYWTFFKDPDGNMVELQDTEF